MGKWIWTVILLWPLYGHAELDAANRDTLIDKLGRVYLNLAPTDASKVPVTLRLADLLAERARQASMADLNSGCTVCTAGKADREKALRLYREVLGRVPEVSRGQVMVQIGHLLELTGQEREALEFYSRTVKEAPTPGSAAESHLSIAEIYFKKGQFQAAEPHYAEVLKIPTAASRGLAAYRMAWCRLNSGQLNASIEQFIKILETPDLLTRNGVAGAQVDRQFQEEVSRDFATVLARREIKLADVEKLYELSPDTTKLANTSVLAYETERLGKKKESLVVWNFVFARQKQPGLRLEALIHMAPGHLDAGQKSEAAGDLEAALAIWRELNGCGKADCAETQKLLRQFVINWNQSEKKDPSAELAKAYSLYLRQFPQETDMAEWAAVVAKTRKEWDQAAHYHQIAIESLRPQGGEKFEAALLAYIETAEASGDEAQLLTAQNLYLTSSAKKSKVFEVRYQQAHHVYEKGQTAQAADILYTLAADKSGPLALRKQAADLALDALAQLKDDHRLQQWSAQFATEFPDSKSDFVQVGQKSLLTESAAAAALGQNERAWELLSRFDSSRASSEDRVTALKNKILLAEKLGRLADGMAAVNELLTLKQVSEADRQFALGRQAYFGELQFDFSTALKATEKLTASDTSEQKLLRLALFADLAGEKVNPYYSRYLKAAHDDDAKKVIAAELVRKSNDPMKELESQHSILEKSPDLLARLYTEAYAKSSSEKILSKAVADLKVKGTDWGRVLTRTALLKEFSIQKTAVAGMKLDASSQKVMAKSIKARAAQLEKLETLAGRAIELGDWTSQLVTLDLLARESDRFYQEILTLPVPEGLSPEEEQQYLSLLGQQAAPYKSKADQAKAKVEEFWHNPNWKADLEKSVANNAEFGRLLTVEIAALKEAAPAAEKEFFDKLSVNPSIAAAPTLAEIEGSRNEVRAKPFDRAAVEKLLGLERRAKNFAMIQYLEGRLKTLNEKETR